MVQSSKPIRRRLAVRAALYGLLWLLLGCLPARAAASRSAPEPQTYIVLSGHSRDVNAVAEPFIEAEKLLYVRDFPEPAQYLGESPTNLYPNGLPDSLVLRLFVAGVTSDKVDSLLSQLEDRAGEFPSVRVIVDDTTWLSYLPGEILLQGKCTLFNDVIDQNDLETVFVFTVYYSGASDICIGNFKISSGNVLDSVQTINDGFDPPDPPVYPDIWAEPNFLTAGAPGNSYVVGSPAAIEPGATGSSTPDTLIGTTGKDVRIVIFDTSPYQESGVFNVKGVDIEVQKPYQLPDSLPEHLGQTADTLAGHGTFVATSIVETAPDAEIVLVQVLNDSAFGAVSTLLRALNDQAVFALGSGADGVIFNYSFGLEAGGPETAALWRLLSLLNEANIVQVAASGNGSAFADGALAMNLPAIHPDVIGVTAVAYDGRLACYANAGDIGAPGGGLARGEVCDVDTMVQACVRGAEHCLIGWDPNSATDQSFGVGTSFAAPLVSAAAAQLVEKLAGERAVTPTPDDIWEALRELARPSAEPAFGVGTLFSPVPSAVGLRGLESLTNWPLLVLAVALLLVIALAALWLLRRRT